MYKWDKKRQLSITLIYHGINQDPGVSIRGSNACECT